MKTNLTSVPLGALRVELNYAPATNFSYLELTITKLFDRGGENNGHSGPIWFAQRTPGCLLQDLHDCCERGLEDVEVRVLKLLCMSSQHQHHCTKMIPGIWVG